MAILTDIERLNYYEGEFLGAVDFQAEQEYHRDMRRRHNLGQHTWGIVTGLELAQPPNGNMDGAYTEVDVYLQPGMAVDGFGREIVVLNQSQLTPSMFAAFAASSPSTPVLMYVWICYQQALLEPPADACTSMNVSDAYARVQETYTLTVTATNSAPPNAAIVVDGNPTTPPVEPSSPAPSPSPTLTDPPPIPLPYDDSIPFQEFSTDDTNLIWWLPLGAVMLDPYNLVFVQTSVAAANSGREYAKNVSAEVLAPAGTYIIADRNSPYPPVASSSDPNLGGVSAEVAGSLQVDFVLNAELTALIGGLYNTSNPVTRPLTIIGNSDGNQDLIEFRDAVTGQSTWYINQEFDGKTLGLNFGEVVQSGSGATSYDNRIFIQPTQTGSVPSPRNVGIGSSTPRNPVGIRGQGKWWELLSFEDNVGTTQWHLNHNPQGTDSSGNPLKPGLNFCETQPGANFRLFLQTGGNVGIGTGAPVASLDVAGGLLHVAQTSGLAASSPGAYLGWNLSGGTGEMDFINNQGSGSGGFAFVNTPSSGSPLTTLVTITGGGNVGIGTATPQQDLSLAVGMNIDQLDANTGTLPTTGPSPALTFGSTSGEGIGSPRSGPNRFSLNFYTGYALQMSIANPMNGAGVFIGAAPVSGPVPQPGSLTVNGNRTYLMGVDTADNHWIMAGGTAEPQFNAIGFTPSTQTVTIGSGSFPWDLTIYGTVNGTKVGYVADRFINRDAVKLERGDVVVLHPTPSSQYYGADGRVPLAEVQIAETPLDARVCGIVDEPALAAAKVSDLDRKKLGKVDVGLMVTLGAYAYCKVDADISPISPGDLLATSPTRGHAQKVDAKAEVRPGSIIGKALGSLTKGKGMIPVFVSHQ